MNWYFASRVRHQPKLIQVAEHLKSIGETFTADWIYQDGLKPYEENLDRVQRLSSEVVKSILDADIFVLVSDVEGTDMFVELGIMLATVVNSSSKKIYILGEHSKRSLMQLHPAITHTRDLQEIFELENIDYQNSSLPTF